MRNWPVNRFSYLGAVVVRFVCRRDFFFPLLVSLALNGSSRVITDCLRLSLVEMRKKPFPMGRPQLIET